MATGPEHYLEAERLLKSAKRGHDAQGTLIDRHQAMRAAAAHATLALAAATALGQGDSMMMADAEAWETACSAARAEPAATT